jgi:hypothetical protein
MSRIRNTLTAALAALALLALAAPPAAAVCQPFLCYLDMVRGFAICPQMDVYMNKDGTWPIEPQDFDDLSGSCPATPHGLVVKVDLPADCTALEVITEFGDSPEGHLLNIGDSFTNDGFGGDAGSFPPGQNAEVHLFDNRLDVFTAADNPADVDTVASANLALQDGALKFVVDDQFVSWGNPYTALETPDLERLFFLGTNPDNRTLYVGANRVVAGAHRTGCGVRHVLMFTR